MPGDAEASSRRLSGAIALGGTVLLCLLAGVFYYLRPPVTPVSEAPATSAPMATIAAPVAPRPSGAWQDLTPAERDALGPLAGEWSKLDATRKTKWVVIADRFPQMSETERERTQERMREWIHLTPEQRRVARDTYLRAHALPPERRAELLAKYQQLPDEEKEHLTELSKEHKSVLPVKPRGKQEPLPNKDQIREGSAQKVPGLMAARPGDAAAPPLPKAASTAAAPAAALAPLPAGAAPAPPSVPQAAGASVPGQSAPQPGVSPTPAGPAATSAHP